MFCPPSEWVFAAMRREGRMVTQGPWGEWWALCPSCGYGFVELSPDHKPAKCSRCQHPL